MSTSTSRRSSEGGIFSRLRRGRSKLSLKDEDYTQSRISDAERSFDLAPSEPGTAVQTPSLSLPLSFANASQTNLRDDTGISQYLSSQHDVSPTKPSHVPAPASAPTLAPSPSIAKIPTPTKPELRPQRPITPQPTPTRKPVPDRSPGVAESIYSTERAVSRGNDSVAVSTWQSRVITEMKEKERLIGRFEALSRVHMALQEEVDKERKRADQAEAAARKKHVDRRAEGNGVSPPTPLTPVSVTSTSASSSLAKEHEAIIIKQRSELQQQRADFDRQKEEIRQTQANSDRERAVMQTQRAELDRQKQAHESLLAERQRDQDSHASLQSDRLKDREQHAAQLASLESDRAKDRQAHATQLSDLSTQLSAAQASLTSSTAEITRLQDQNAQLKTSIAKSSQSSIQTTDAEFSEQMAQLSTDVHNWVANNFRKARIDFEKLEKQGETKELKQIRKAVPKYREAAQKAPLPFLQALVSARLMDEVWDDDFYVAMPGLVEEHETKEESGRGGLGYLREAWKVLQAQTNPQFHAWRSLTVSLLRRTHDPYLTALTNKLISRVAFSINTLLGTITSSAPGGSALGSSPLPSRVRDLQAFISKSIDLARQFRGQKSVFTFELPGADESSDGLVRVTRFEGESMVDILEESREVNGNSESKKGEDGGEGGEKVVIAGVWPLVVKTSEQDGEKSVVWKARVVCAQ